MNGLVIAGCGLLGTSVALAFRRVFPDAAVVGVEPDAAARRAARELDVYSHVVESVAAAQDWYAANGLKYITGIAATPPAYLAETMLALASFCELVMDVGSIKTRVVDELQAAARVSPNLVPCHPMAGSHERGPKAGYAELFDGRWVFVVPMASSAPAQVRAAHEFWIALGARTEQIDPAAHDRAVAYTSHLPHLLASAYMDVQTPEQAAAGTGFMEFTRLAKANPEMWSQVLLSNQRAWRPLLHHYIEVLRKVDGLLETGDGAAVQAWLEAMRLARVGADQALDPMQKQV